MRHLICSTQSIPMLTDSTTKVVDIHSRAVLHIRTHKTTCNIHHSLPAYFKWPFVPLTRQTIDKSYPDRHVHCPRSVFVQESLESHNSQRSPIPGAERPERPIHFVVERKSFIFLRFVVTHRLLLLLLTFVHS